MIWDWLTLNMRVIVCIYYEVKKGKRQAIISKSKVNNRGKCLDISQVIRAKLYSKLSHVCL